MIRGICNTGPVRERRPTAAHRKAGLPGWVTPDLCDAVLSAEPTATVKRIAAEYRAAHRYVDADILEDQARAFAVLPRREDDDD